MCEFAGMPEPALGDEAEGEDDDCCGAHCDEERLEACGTHVGYIAFTFRVNIGFHHKLIGRKGGEDLRYML